MLALFTQLHMSLLRNGVRLGASWGMEQSVQNGIVGELAKWEKDYDEYLGAVVERQPERLHPHTPTAPGPHRKAIYNY